MNRRYSVIAALLALVIGSAVASANPSSVEINAGKAWSSTLPSLFADVAEVEPNSTYLTAQFLGCGNVLRPATIAAVGDTDYVTFTANAGDFITIGTDADGAGSVGDTRIRLFDSAGGSVLASDDDGGPGLYSLISGFAAPYTGTYTVGIAAYSSQTGPYKAFVICCPPVRPAGDLCADAAVLECGDFSLSGNTACYTNDYTPLASGTGGCTGYVEAGRDLVYRVYASGGDVLNATFTSTGDGALYVVTDCADPATTCVVGADATLAGQPEVITGFVFPATGFYYLILDTFGTNTSGDYTLTGSIDCVTVGTSKKSWGELKVIYR